ncbi:STAS domain-containing protein [Amycolatopsis sp.]|jgi:anti-anti-sigma regulatory factor|uniref:STAS domain-containing protein n=1 Tax=Amycolatopsis sp. TaxID=37632 RepID=UPI002DFA9ED5|nr:STAS domain-containing protein [Amycolatopsis sp.]
MIMSSRLAIELDDLDGCTVVRPVGVLDVSTYPVMRDTLLKCVVDEPAAVIVDLGPLVIPSTVVLSVFSVVAMRTGDWPGVPIMLVARQESQRETVRQSAVRKWVPCFEDLDAAFGAVGEPPPRRRVLIELAGRRSSSREARRLVREIGGNWGLAKLGHVLRDAELVATELVENTVRHTVSDLTLRLELRNGSLTVAVADDDPRGAVPRERAGECPQASGLVMVAQVARAWGCTPSTNGGKIVWAVLDTGKPGLGRPTARGTVPQ